MSLHESGCGVTGKCSRPDLAAAFRPLRMSHRHTQQALQSRWDEASCEDSVAVATIDRLVHHAETLSITADSYHLNDLGLGRSPPVTTTD